jgi:uncharacterized protein YjcR
MARFTKSEREKRIEHAKQLYCKGFDADTIAEILGDVSVSTINKWINEKDFEKSKRSQIIALSAIRDSILESYADLLDGKKPKVKPDEAAKYATAFEKFSAKKQVLTYMYEAFELLCEAFMKDIQKAKTKKEKEQIHAYLRESRARQERVLTQLTNEVLGNE